MSDYEEIVTEDGFRFKRKKKPDSKTIIIQTQETPEERKDKINKKFTEIQLKSSKCIDLKESLHKLENIKFESKPTQESQKKPSNYINKNIPKYPTKTVACLEDLKYFNKFHPKIRSAPLFIKSMEEELKRIKPFFLEVEGFDKILETFKLISFEKINELIKERKNEIPEFKKKNENQNNLKNAYINFRSKEINEMIEKYRDKINDLHKVKNFSNEYEEELNKYIKSKCILEVDEITEKSLESVVDEVLMINQNMNEKKIEKLKNIDDDIIKYTFIGKDLKEDIEASYNYLYRRFLKEGEVNLEFICKMMDLEI